MSYDCSIGQEPCALCIDECCCVECHFMENEGHTHPCKNCAAIGGMACHFLQRESSAVIIPATVELED